MRWIIVTLRLLCMTAAGRAQSDFCFRVTMEDALDRELLVPADGDRVLLRGSFENGEWQPDPDTPPFGNRRLTLTGNPQNVPIGDFIIDRYDLAAVGMPVMFSVEELRADFNEMRRVLEE